MSYMSCPRCGLSIRIRAPFLSPDWCPRCIARAHTVIPMVCSDDRPSTPPVAEANSVPAGPIVESVIPATIAAASLERNPPAPPRPAAPSLVPELTSDAVQTDGSGPSPPPGRVTPPVLRSQTTDEPGLAEGPTPTPLDHRFVNEWS